MDRVTIIHKQQLEPGTCNDDPYTLFFVQDHLSGNCGWVAGPHGVSGCAIDDWFAFLDYPVATKDEALCGGAVDFSRWQLRNTLPTTGE